MARESIEEAVVLAGHGEHGQLCRGSTDDAHRTPTARPSRHDDAGGGGAPQHRVDAIRSLASERADLSDPNAVRGFRRVRETLHLRRGKLFLPLVGTTGRDL